jgi:hypothetical protein
MIEFTTEDLATRRAMIVEALKTKTCEVVFTKVDGSLREMPCTLDPRVIPPPPVHETNTDNPIDFPKVKKENPAVMSVWCTDKEAWRSFRIDNVLRIREVTGQE